MLERTVKSDVGHILARVATICTGAAATHLNDRCIASFMHRANDPITINEGRNQGISPSDISLAAEWRFFVEIATQPHRRRCTAEGEMP